MNIWPKWKRFSKKASDIQVNILLSIVYFLFIVPIGFILRLNNKQKSDQTFWVLRKKISPSLKEGRQQ